MPHETYRKACATTCMARHLPRTMRFTLLVALTCAALTHAAELIDRPPTPRHASERHTSDLPEIRQRKILRALVTYSRTDFFLVNKRPRGLIYELLNQYEKHLNAGIKQEVKKTRIVFVPVPFDQLIPALLAGKGDVVGALLTITPEREKKVAFATKRTLIVNELVVTHKSVGALQALEDLAGKEVYVLRGSSYVEHLRALNTRLKAQNHKPVIIKEADRHLVTEDILELVNAEVVRVTVADDYKARLWAQVLPNIEVHEHLKIAADNVVGAAIRKDNPALKKDIETFLEKAKGGTLLGNMLFKRYYQNVRWIKNPTSKEERQKLKRYIELFRKYGTQYGFDYLAVAAQAYQESGLNHNKKSPRGAVGIMQLLPSTAADPNVDIQHIKEVENNIHAGVKYLAFLRDRYFSDPALLSEDRFAFTWAAYNAGPGNVHRMRQLAAEMGLDANQWFHNVELAASKITGRETVKYVADIYKYYLAYSMLEELQAKKVKARQLGKTRK